MACGALSVGSPNRAQTSHNAAWAALRPWDRLRWLHGPATTRRKRFRAELMDKTCAPLDKKDARPLSVVLQFYIRSDALTTPRGMLRREPPPRGRAERACASRPTGT